MDIEKIERRTGIEANKKLNKAYDQMQLLIEALEKKDIPPEELLSINERIEFINSFKGSEKELKRTLKKSYLQILKSLEEKLKYVPKHHYMRLGMVFGLLAGVSFPSLFRVFGLIDLSNSSLALSMGMLIGIIVGTLLDVQAQKNGKRLEME